MISIFENYKNTNTILEHFEYYDVRQENYEKNSPQNTEAVTDFKVEKSL
jgi:hypothetical protein